MKKLCLILAVIIYVSAVFGSFAALADSTSYSLLTLKEAKAIALRNDVQYALQDSYIYEAREEYADISDDSSLSTGDIAKRAAAYISRQVNIENAAYSVRKAELSKEDLKRTSDYEVTDYFYTVIEAQNSLADAKRDLDQKKNSLSIAKFKYELKIITKNSVTQTEEAVASSQATYNNAVLELEKYALQLGRAIGEDLDLSRVKLDNAIIVPEISSLLPADIIADNIKNNPTYFNLTEQQKLLKYELDLTEEKYYDYFEDTSSISSSVEEEFDDMLYEAKQAFDNEDYSYNEKLDDLEETILNQYDKLVDLYKTYEDEKLELNENKLEIFNNKIKLQLGLINSSEYESSLAALSKLENQLYSTKADIVRQYMDLTQYSINKEI